MRISYNWLQNYFEEKLPSPEDISEGIIFHSFEVEEMDKVVLSAQAGDDTIFDIKILPDRAHDCLSHWGIAKEISAIFDMKIKEHVYKIFDNKETNLNIEIEDEKCLRYMGRIVRNIKVGESPDWLKEKLNAIGQKSINNIVDAANFVMFDLGQPIHAFDLDKLTSEKLIIRNGRIGEKITTLDKKEVDLDESILVIADEKYPLAIAGIKGGIKAEVDMNTKNIVIEVANFNPTTTRKTSKKINILTDAVKRYENEISPELCSKVMDMMTSMIFELAGGEVEEVIDIYPIKATQRFIKVSVDFINKRLGSDFTKEEIKSVWDKLNFIYKDTNGEYEIEVPYLRLDLNSAYDLTEEVIRILGYDRLKESVPEIIHNNSFTDDTYYKILLARDKLLNDGYSEVMTYAFRDKGDIEVLASASNKNFLRNNLSDGLKESIKLNTLNLPLLDMSEIKVFEIGNVFLNNKEEMRVAYGDKKNIFEMTLSEFINKNSLLVGEKISLHELIIKGDLLREPSQETPLKTFKMWSFYPFITRDIAVWLPNEVESYQVYKVIKENAGDFLIKEPFLFDSFTKEGRTSYAYRLVFQSYEKTLTDAEINPIMEKINSKISSFGWEVR